MTRTQSYPSHAAFFSGISSEVSQHLGESQPWFSLLNQKAGLVSVGCCLKEEGIKFFCRLVPQKIKVTCQIWKEEHAAMITELWTERCALCQWAARTPKKGSVSLARWIRNVSQEGSSPFPRWKSRRVDHHSSTADQQGLGGFVGKELQPDVFTLELNYSGLFSSGWDRNICFSHFLSLCIQSWSWLISWLWWLQREFSWNKDFWMCILICLKILLLVFS